MAVAEEKLIAKKELLSRYGISYGALYRWKRKGLIPEEWFIRRSTVTGQETFFPGIADLCAHRGNSGAQGRKLAGRAGGAV